MTISCIVAMNDGGCIGLNNALPWHLPADLMFFKKHTMGHHLLMGRKCFDSIGRALPGRTNIIVTRNPEFAISDCLIVGSIGEGILRARERGEQELFIIGGGQIYNQSKALWNKLYLTLVGYHGPCDTYFPELSLDRWTLDSREDREPDGKNPLPHSFRIYSKKTAHPG
ncbi:MAG: Dihydrofolate reductase [Saprospiraceae bacterium]|jgi:dihydrofolate reductase|nr:Dihydrofolate reductase [Saprospiraceae bacterium]